MRRLAAAGALALALLAPSTAVAARFAVGLAPGADPAAVAEAVERTTGRPAESLAPLPALVAGARDGSALRRLDGVRYVERLGERRLAMVPNDPLAPRQWYLSATRAYDAWDVLPPFAGVRVAVIDSGVDAGHPDLASRLVATRSFVGGSARADAHGHGTFVSGVIAAAADNGVGIAGTSPHVELLVAKVVTESRTIPVEAEARAIRWAVENGARVINMSLGGVRDPVDEVRDTYSQLEADAVAYAVSQGVVVVAAVGNGDQAPVQPWRYASYPAALPHVLGVSAVAQSGASPPFSNRDAIFNDIAAPGEEIVSTLPRGITNDRPSCPEQGYSLCGPPDYRTAEGTSFAAPQAAAAAATLLAVRPGLRPEQVTTILERTAVDANAASGCRTCPLGRDRFTGWGRLDVAAALAALDGPLPPRDRYEANDGAGDAAFPLWGQRRRVDATLDFWDDQDDVYRVHLRRGQRLYASLVGEAATDPSLALWKPGTVDIADLSRQDDRVRLSSRPGRDEYLAYRAPAEGFHYLHVRLTAQGAGGYRLSVVKE